MTTTTATQDNETRLPTARSSGPQERSVLAILRSVMPRRPLRMFELERVAELQANRLLELAGLNAPAVPSQIISDLPRIRVVSVVDLPVSGTAQWVSGQWLLSLNAGEHEARQRFSLAHEFKHVIDHPFRDVIYSCGPGTPSEQAERIADYFAACLLMPKKWVVRSWGNGVQRLSALSEQFEVSPRAMQVRLWQLGLTEPTPRCAPSAYRRKALVHGGRMP
jgi:hypothetical protein